MDNESAEHTCVVCEALGTSMSFEHSPNNHSYSELMHAVNDQAFYIRDLSKELDDRTDKLNAIRQSQEQALRLESLRLTIASIGKHGSSTEGFTNRAKEFLNFLQPAEPTPVGDFEAFEPSVVKPSVVEKLPADAITMEQVREFLADVEKEGIELLEHHSVYNEAARTWNRLLKKHSLL